MIVVGVVAPDLDVANDVDVGVDAVADVGVAGVLVYGFLGCWC